MIVGSCLLSTSANFVEGVNAGDESSNEGRGSVRALQARAFLEAALVAGSSLQVRGSVRAPTRRGHFPNLALRARLGSRIGKGLLPSRYQPTRRWQRLASPAVLQRVLSVSES